MWLFPVRDQRHEIEPQVKAKEDGVEVRSLLWLNGQEPSIKPRALLQVIYSNANVELDTLYARWQVGERRQDLDPALDLIARLPKPLQSILVPLTGRRRIRDRPMDTAHLAGKDGADLLGTERDNSVHGFEIHRIDGFRVLVRYVDSDLRHDLDRKWIEGRRLRAGTLNAYI